LTDARPPAVSGRFYPGDRAELERTLRDLLGPLVPIAHPAGARAAIVPHAGYLYSGVTAAHAFARIRIPPLVVIVAPNHTGLSRAPGGASLWEAGVFDTPLGGVTVDAAWSRALLDACPLVSVDHLAHRDEHAVEVELPFLKFLAPAARIVPLILAWDDWESSRTLGEALARVVRGSPEPVLLLASSDLSHYEPANAAELKDAQALAAVQQLDGEELLRRCHREGITMCGRAPVAAVLAAARALGASRADVVDYRHSGWVTGDESSVVGYAGVVIP
jgi:MEMO1 family protein